MVTLTVPELVHVVPRMTKPVFVLALRTLRVMQVRVPETTERMVPSLVRTGIRIHVLQFFR
jgi:hypothetical protein